MGVTPEWKCIFCGWIYKFTRTVHKRPQWQEGIKGTFITFQRWRWWLKRSSSGFRTKRVTPSVTAPDDKSISVTPLKFYKRNCLTFAGERQRENYLHKNAGCQKMPEAHVNWLPKKNPPSWQEECGRPWRLLRALLHHSMLWIYIDWSTRCMRYIASVARSSRSAITVRPFHAISASASSCPGSNRQTGVFSFGHFSLVQ